LGRGPFGAGGWGRADTCKAWVAQLVFHNLSY
jgi:hypothetical protein